MQHRSDARFHQLVRLRIGIDAVRQEDDNRIVGGVGPSERTRKTRMAETSHRARLGGRATALLSNGKLVEADTSTVVVA